MAQWDRLKESAQTMQTQLDAKRHELISGASMAKCALVAAADGSVDPDEHRRVSPPTTFCRASPPRISSSTSTPTWTGSSPT